MLIGFLAIAFSLVTRHDIFGYDVPYGLPWFLALAVIAIAYSAVATPVGAMLNASNATARGNRDHGGWFGSLVIAAALIALAWTFWADARDVIETVYFAIRHAVEAVTW